MCSTERNRDFVESGCFHDGRHQSNEIRKTYRHYIKEAVDRLDREQERSWLAEGLDKHSSPKIATVQ